jgi:ribosomal protein S18 acetylase RimI-like enzyme
VTARLELVGAPGFEPWVDAAVDIYLTALDRPPEIAPSRRASTREHLSEPGFRAVLVWEDEALVGFGYGYDDLPGQWWHDIVLAALTPELAKRWMARAFQVTEVHVLPGYQRRGLGRRIVSSLLDGVSRPTAVLSAFDQPTPARELYRSMGFVDVITGLRFPGNVEIYTVMAADLPLGQQRR